MYVLNPEVHSSPAETRYEYVQKSNEGCFLQMVALDTVKPVLFLGYHGYRGIRFWMSFPHSVYVVSPPNMGAQSD